LASCGRKFGITWFGSDCAVCEDWACGAAAGAAVRADAGGRWGGGDAACAGGLPDVDGRNEDGWDDEPCDGLEGALCADGGEDRYTLVEGRR
jgi:hypothetical protein